MERMRITIDPKGNPQIEVQCVKGKACEKVSASIEAALGKRVADTKTQEYYQEQKNVAHVTRRA